VFWWFSLAFTLTLFTAIAITVHLIPYLTERGFSSEFAAAAVGLTGGSQIPGRLLFSWLSRRVSRRRLTMLLFAAQVVGLVILSLSSTTAGVIAFAVIFGAGAGASSPARAALLADLYGAGHYGSINGAQTLVMTVARAAAPISTAALYQAANSYQPVLWLLVVFCAGAVGALLMCRERSPE
jgi:MFS family permease